MKRQPKADMIRKLAAVFHVEWKDHAGAAYSLGVLDGLMLADRHPEAVGIVLAEIMAGRPSEDGGSPMPDDLRRSHEARADRIALAE